MEECTRGCEFSFNYGVKCRKSFTNQSQLKNCLCTISWICFTSHRLSRVLFTLIPFPRVWVFQRCSESCWVLQRRENPGLCSRGLCVPPLELSPYREPPQKPGAPWWAQITPCTHGRECQMFVRECPVGYLKNV